MAVCAHKKRDPSHIDRYKVKKKISHDSHIQVEIKRGENGTKYTEFFPKTVSDKWETLQTKMSRNLPLFSFF